MFSKSPLIPDGVTEPSYLLGFSLNLQKPLPFWYASGTSPNIPRLLGIYTYVSQIILMWFGKKVKEGFWSTILNQNRSGFLGEGNDLSLRNMHHFNWNWYMGLKLGGRSQLNTGDSSNNRGWWGLENQIKLSRMSREKVPKDRPPKIHGFHNFKRKMFLLF